MNDKTYIELSINILCKIENGEKEKVLDKLNKIIKKSISELDLVNVKIDISAIDEMDLILTLANNLSDENFH